ncbi:ABC transporter substrate-binding protein [Nocardioides sp. NPDC101246]|uniref:ABC transporter substrate-binding protein n=1 Tax=Nocardioides sp. NPDC101246 TaxID=3364336 RepID=UPI0038047230
MRLKRTVIAASAIAALTLTAACGGGGGGGEDPAGEFKAGGGAGAGKDATAEGPLEVPSDAKMGGTITVLSNNAPHTLDPTRTYYTDSGAIMSGLVTRSLTQYVYDEKSGDSVLVPDLATDLGQASEDGLTWTFTLKDGIKYEDGTDVTAEDVVYGIKRSFAIDTLTDGPTYQTTFFKDGQKYKGPFADTDAELKKLPDYDASAGWYGGEDYDGVEADGNKVIIHLAQPFPELDYYASFPVFSPIPKAKDKDPLAYESHPMATGPYKFESYKPGTSLTLVKNDQWDADSDPGRIQAADAFDFKFAQDTAKLENQILGDKGAAQAMMTYDDVTPPTYKSIKESAPDNLIEGTSPCTYMYRPDQTKITDKKVREAISWAYPYQAAWKASGEIVGVTIQPGTSLLPPGTAGRVEYQYPKGQDGQTTDPEKAKALLKEAGAEGFELKWHYQRDDENSVAKKDQMVKGFEAAGFKATPVASTDETYRDDESNLDAPINLRYGGWCSDWPSGGSWFPAQWIGSNANKPGMPNPTNFKEADADAKQAEILKMDADKVPAAWGEFDKWMQETYMVEINAGYDANAFIKGSQVGGVVNDPVKGMPSFSIMYLK